MSDSATHKPATPPTPDQPAVAAPTIPPCERPYSVFQNSPRNLLILIAIGLVAWASIHALGTWRGGEGNVGLGANFKRGLVVVACMATFLGFWWVLLRSQKPRRTKFRLPAEPTKATLPQNGPRRSRPE